MSDFGNVYSMMKGIIQELVDQVQMDLVMGKSEQSLMVATTYLLYVIMYQEIYKFNPAHQQVGFNTLVEATERYGVERLKMNLGKQLEQYMKIISQQGLH